MDRLRHVAKMAVGDLTQLVIVVEDYTSVPGNPEILQQQVAGKDIRVSEVADALAVVEHCKLGCRCSGRAQIQVERRHATLNV